MSAASLEFRCIGDNDGFPLDANDYALMFLFCLLAYRLLLHRIVLEIDRGLMLPDVLYGCGTELRELVFDRRCAVVTVTDILALSINCKKQNCLRESRLVTIWCSIGSTLTRIYVCAEIQGPQYGNL